MSFSVKSGAGATRTMAFTRRGIAMATRQAIQPPMEEPTNTSGPAVSSFSTPSASSRHRVIVPSAKSPEDSPCPK